MIRLYLLALLGGACAWGAPVQALEVRILSTMLTDSAGVGEWGFAALVTVDGRVILFDTGARPDTVLKNARELKVDLRGVSDVILSHNHGDHTGGLMTLLREYPKALSRAHVGRGIVVSRARADGSEANPMIQTRREYEAAGGKFVEHAGFAQIAPGVWLTGPVPRKHSERNWSVSGQLRDAAGKLSEDNLPEDMSMIVETAQGLVLISGCGHAGLINTVEHARAKFGGKPLHAAIGGFHLFNASDAHLDWTAGKLKEFGLGHFVGAHCTGIEATYRLRERTGLDRRRAVVGAVGAGFRLGEGVLAGTIAR
jgi:7,8-dihydropterin-6-yl-methyl-4-(beta-D-ribofuranosyl)aminobenzene 5'-phosphate synthase